MTKQSKARGRPPLAKRPSKNIRIEAEEPKPYENSVRTFHNLGKALDAALSDISQFGTFGEWLRFCQLEEDDKNVNSTEKKLFKLANQLSTGRAYTSRPKKNMPGSIIPISQFHNHRAPGNIISIMAPLEIIKFKRSIKNKTLGMLRIQGEYSPLKCAISGAINIHEDHLIMLDSAVMTKEVFHLATYRDVNFRYSRGERQQKLPKGYTYCSHVEPKLMLWYALFLLRELTGELHTSIRKQVAHINQIRRYPKRPAVEILLDRKPCKFCLNFRDEIEDLTGIEYIFPLIQKTGNVYKEKDVHGNNVYPIFASYSDLESSQDEEEEEEDEDEDDEEDSRLVHSHVAGVKSQIAVVIPTMKRKALSQRAEVLTETNVSTIQRFKYQPPVPRLPKQAPRRFQRTIDIADSDDDCVSDWHPASPQRYSKSRQTKETPTRRPPTRGSSTSPTEVETPTRRLPKRGLYGSRPIEIEIETETETETEAGSPLRPNNKKRKITPGEFDFPSPSPRLIGRGHYRFNE